MTKASMMPYRQQQRRDAAKLRILARAERSDAAQLKELQLRGSGACVEALVLSAKLAEAHP